jgi:hypothetical protein
MPKRSADQCSGFRPWRSRQLAWPHFGYGKPDTRVAFCQPATGGNSNRPATTPSTVRSSSSDSQRRAVPPTSSRTSANSGALASHRRRNRFAGNPTIRWSVNSTKTSRSSSLTTRALQSIAARTRRQVLLCRGGDVTAIPARQCLVPRAASPCHLCRMSLFTSPCGENLMSCGKTAIRNRPTRGALALFESGPMGSHEAVGGRKSFCGLVSSIAYSISWISESTHERSK